MVGLLLSLCLFGPTMPAEPLVHIVEQSPTSVKQVSPGVYLVDFGRVAFGNLKLAAPRGKTGKITVHFGEAFENGRINRKPPGTVRYEFAEAKLGDLIIAPKPNARNTETDSKSHPPAILTPKEWGVLTPFRWVEIEGWSGELKPSQIKRRAAFDARWEDNAASFHCDNETLNRIWDLCQYSIKATTFAGIFVDGDRERIPYEADAYLNQLSYYTTSSQNAIPRATFDHLMKYGTWPTEWAPHMVFMAYADWMRTGDKVWLGARFDALKSKMLLDRVGPDGLVQSSQAHMSRDDIVDWPTGERDGFVFDTRNVVVNSFYLKSLKLMSEMALGLGKRREAAEFAAKESAARLAFQKAFFDQSTGIYRDGANVNHSSLHANLFPLALGLVDQPHRARVAAWLAQRGMKCSVYAAQYLLEGLFVNGQEAAAIDLMTAPGDRSWRHMVESGTTITWEAWDQKYKPNQDWNHAWGAAPANLLPRYVLGVQPKTPGWKSAVIRPVTGNLKFARGTVPTFLGPVSVDWKVIETFTLNLKLPKGMSAHVELPAQSKATRAFVNGKEVASEQIGNWIILDQVVSGAARICLRNLSK